MGCRGDWGGGCVLWVGCYGVLRGDGWCRERDGVLCVVELGECCQPSPPTGIARTHTLTLLPSCLLLGGQGYSVEKRRNYCVSTRCFIISMSFFCFCFFGGGT